MAAVDYGQATGQAMQPNAQPQGPTPGNMGDWGAAWQSAKTNATKNPQDPALQAAIDEFMRMSKGLGEEFQGAKGSEEDINRYYEQAKAPIESNFFQGAGQVSSYLARQGLGSSGMNLGAHAQLENNRSSLEGQAKMAATDKAIALEREGIMGRLSANSMGLQPELQKYGIDTSKIIAQMQMQMQMDMLKSQMEMQGLGGLGSLAGQLGGAYLMGG